MLDAFYDRLSHRLRQQAYNLSRLSTLVPPAPGISYGNDYYPEGDELVVCIHGLWRSKFAMGKLAQHFRKSGYAVLNVSYPSFSENLEGLVELLDQFVLEHAKAHSKIHFVTHSLGGVILRRYFNNLTIPKPGRVVMLSPPLHGSWIMDWLADSPCAYFFGPAGFFLSSRSMSQEAQDLPSELLIIMGDKPKITAFQFLFGEVANDGIVRVSSGRVDGGHEFVVLPVDHTLINSDPQVLELSHQFIKQGVIW